MEKKQHEQSHTVKHITFFIIGCVTLFIVGSSLVSMIGKYRYVQKETSRLEEELADLAHKKQQVLSISEEIQSEEGRERYAREKFRVVKPGESLIVLSDEEKTIETPSSKKSFWDSFLEWFR